MLDFICGKIISPMTTVMILFGGIFFGFCMLIFYVPRHLHGKNTAENKKSTASVSDRMKLSDRINKKSAGRKNRISPFSSLTLALAGTLGVGNITGVAAAILSGGAGAIFWMWISGIVAMPVKYAEVTLAVRTRTTDKNGKYHGGAMYYIKSGAFASVFAVLCVCTSFFLGNAVQSRAASDALSECFGTDPVIVGTVGAILVFSVIFGGVRSISDVTVRLIPLLCGVYILLSGIIIAKNLSLIPTVFTMIVSDALSPRAVCGGMLGFLLRPSVRFGVARGLFSNEAGCGTAPTAHAESSGVSAEKQGLLGIFEVFADTILLCTLTAVVILIFGLKHGFSSDDAMKTVTDAFSLLLGDFSGKVIAASTAFFAFATVVCWAHYGSEAIYFIFSRINADPTAIQKIYYLLFSVSVFAGVFPKSALIWQTSDLLIGCLTVINIFALFRSAGIIFRREYRGS